LITKKEKRRWKFVVGKKIIMTTTTTTTTVATNQNQISSPPPCTSSSISSRVFDDLEIPVYLIFFFLAVAFWIGYAFRGEHNSHLTAIEQNYCMQQYRGQKRLVDHVRDIKIKPDVPRLVSNLLRDPPPRR